MTGGRETPARDIAERLLDITGEALKTGDFDLFAQVFAFPNTATTGEGTHVVQSRDQLRALFDDMREAFALMKVTEIVRVVDAAEYRSPTQIASTHTSHLFSGGSRIGDAYPVFSILELRDGQWKGVYADYAVPPRSPQATVIQRLSSPQPERRHAEN